MPCGSLARSCRRSVVWPSRGSPTKRYALASAAGPMKSGSASIERQALTQAPHWMQAIDWVTSIIDSGGTMYSRSGGVALGQQPRGDAADLRPVRRLHVGHEVLQHRHVAHRLDDDRRGVAVGVRTVRPFARLADLGLAGEAGLAVDLHPARAADRGAARAANRERAVLVVLVLEQPVEHRQRRVEVDVEGVPVGPLARLGLEAADLERVVRAISSTSSPSAPTASWSRPSS